MSGCKEFLFADGPNRQGSPFPGLAGARPGLSLSGAGQPI